MCMSCDTGRLTKRKKIILFSSLGAGGAAATYFVLTASNSPIAAAAIPTALAFGACPLMCAAMGGVMWLSGRLSKNKNNHISTHIQELKSLHTEASCCRLTQQNGKYPQKVENDFENENEG
jgi:hypothetical protein